MASLRDKDKRFTKMFSMELAEFRKSVGDETLYQGALLDCNRVLAGPVQELQLQTKKLLRQQSAR